MQYVIGLDEGTADPDAMGGKGANLAVLRHAGFNVPAGFCLTAAAYREFVRFNDLQAVTTGVVTAPELHLPRNARAAAGELSPLLESATLPTSVHQELIAAYDRIPSNSDAPAVVSVRSSALSEDAGSASSAGLYESYLNLRDAAAVEDAVLNCYRSLWSARAIQYRAFKHLDGGQEAMAVVVMAMVPADVAGVTFTLNPLTGDRTEVVINASWGLGEAIVSGRVTPDQFIVNRKLLRITERTINAKEVRIDTTADGASGTSEEAVAEATALLPALSDDRLLVLTSRCLEIEALYQRPMDIEWAFASDQLFLLQARPITGVAQGS